MLTTRLVSRTPVLQMRGAIAGERAANALCAALHRFDRIGIDSVVVDLTNVAHIDLRGLDILAAAERRFQKRGCHVTLVGVTARLRDLITITFLVTAFETHETVDAFVVDRGVGRAAAGVGVESAKTKLKTSLGRAPTGAVDLPAGRMLSLLRACKPAAAV